MDKEAEEPEPDVFAGAFQPGLESADDLEKLADGMQASNPPEAVEEPQEAGEDPPARIRGVPLDRDEEIERVFLPNEGLSDTVPSAGQALILTSRRLIVFRGVDGFRDTHFARVSGISQCSVRTGQRNWAAMLQGLMVMAGGAFLYIVVGYWLAGRISGPNVPVLNIDVAPLMALLIILAGLLVLLQNYFTRPAGAMIFHGVGVGIEFPFRSSLDLQHVYEFVDKAHAMRTDDSETIPESAQVIKRDGNAMVSPGSD